jgi:bacterioferritin
MPTLKKLNVERTLELLSRIMEFELAGVVRYTHYSLMVSGPNRIPIVQFMKQQASESLLHAQTAGEIIVGLGGHPTLQIAPIPESYKHSVKDILEESLAHEREALRIYQELLSVVSDRSVYLEEFARTQIAQEELHGMEVRKMLRDVTAPYEQPQAEGAAGVPARAAALKTPKTTKGKVARVR